jgi:hypothetical protein
MLTHRVRAGVAGPGAARVYRPWPLTSAAIRERLLMLLTSAQLREGQSSRTGLRLGLPGGTGSPWNPVAIF